VFQRNVEITMNKLLGAAVATLALSGASAAFAADNATATATANVITPLSVTSDQNLVFGNLLAGTGGTVTVSPTNVRTGTVTLLAGVAPLAAHFHVVGDTTGGATYAVTYGKTDLAGPGASLVLSAITADSAPTTGTADIKVGATITIANGQAAGTYLGSLTATATYN
jgi:Mat/Ecp fimbriae major subunit